MKEMLSHTHVSTIALFAIHHHAQSMTRMNWTRNSMEQLYVKEVKKKKNFIYYVQLAAENKPSVIKKIKKIRAE